MSIKIRPLNDRIFVERAQPEEKVGQLYVANQDAPQEGTVRYVGPGVREYGKGFIKPTVEVGDRVIFGKFSGAEIEVDGMKLLILTEAEVFAVISREPDVEVPDEVSAATAAT